MRKKLREYRQRSAEETREAREAAAIRRRRKAEEVGRAAEEAEEQGEREIQMDWASVVEVESDRNK